MIGGGAWFLIGSADAARPAVTVWKSPSCGCCGAWVRHMRAAGFPVTVHDVGDVQPIKDGNGVPDALRSCHTALVDGYVVEGHVPAGDIKRLLEERPAAKGLAVPGMPSAAPGMDGPHEPYHVVLFGSPGGMPASLVIEGGLEGCELDRSDRRCAIMEGAVERVGPKMMTVMA